MERIRQIVFDEIFSSLTIGRSDNDEVPYTFEQIKDFITINNTKINEIIYIIYLDYLNDGDLNELIDLKNLKAHSWVREYMGDIL